MLERLCWKERAGESRREEERAWERRREKEIVRKKALLIHHHVRILPTQSQSGIRRSTRNGTVHETPPTNFSNKWRTRALPSYCNWFCMKSRARVSVFAKNSIYGIKIFDPQKSQNSWLSRSIRILVSSRIRRFDSFLGNYYFLTMTETHCQNLHQYAEGLSFLILQKHWWVKLLVLTPGVFWNFSFFR